MKRIILFTLAFLLLFCSCAHRDRIIQPPTLNDGHYESFYEPDNCVQGGVIKIHKPLEDAGSSSPTDDNAVLDDIPSQFPEDDLDQKTEEPLENRSKHSAQIPIYSVDGDKNFGGDHSSLGSHDMSGNAANIEAPFTGDTFMESDATMPDSPEPDVNITAYTMNTRYENDTGKSILELRICTPMIDAKSAEAQLLFNRYYSAKALEYALYANETLFPEVKASQAVGEPQISSAEMAHSVLYHSEGYLCVKTSYTESLMNRLKTRREAALFDMSSAMLLDEWEINEPFDSSIENILSKISTIPIIPKDSSGEE